MRLWRACATAAPLLQRRAPRMVARAARARGGSAAAAARYLTFVRRRQGSRKILNPTEARMYVHVHCMAHAQHRIVHCIVCIASCIAIVHRMGRVHVRGQVEAQLRVFAAHWGLTPRVVY